MRKRMAWVMLVSLVLMTAAAAAGGDTSGQTLYDQKCAMCHGKDGVAKKGVGDGSANLNDPAWQKGTSVDAIVKLTTEGKGKMKGYEGKLTDDEMKLIAEYILTLK
jgi:cytochrome c6